MGAIDLLFISSFLFFVCEGKSVFLHMPVCKGTNLYFFLRSFLICSSFSATATAYKKRSSLHFLDLLLFFTFDPFGISIHDSPQPMLKIKSKVATLYGLFQTYFIFENIAKMNQKVIGGFSSVSLPIITMLLSLV